MQLVLDSAVGLRATARVLQAVSHWLPGVEKTPAFTTGQNWLLRLGLHALERPKQQADDWLWLVDHTIQLGNHKVLLIVGMRLSSWNEQRGPLTHHDLELLALEPVTQSTGEVIQEQFARASEKTGVPRAILSDGGTDIQRGLKLFGEDHVSIARLSDIKHEAARVVKKTLEADPRWKEFIHETNLTKAKIRQTELAHLMPPPPREKARYMNADVFLKWGRKTCDHVQGQWARTTSDDSSRLRERLGWLVDFDDDLNRWAAMFGVVSRVNHHVRQEGYHRFCAWRLRKQLESLPRTSCAGRVGQALLRVVREQSRQAKPGEHLVGSTEVLESLIGKGKRLQGQHSRGGFTKMVLSMGAAVLPLTNNLIATALDAVKTIDVAEWSRTNLGQSLASKRRTAYATIKPEQNQNKPPPATTPHF